MQMGLLSKKESLSEEGQKEGANKWRDTENREGGSRVAKKRKKVFGSDESREKGVAGFG